MVTQAAKDAFARVYATIKDNGIVDIGLQAALDVGVKPSDYIAVPRSCMKPIKLHADDSNEVTQVCSCYILLHTQLALLCFFCSILKF